MVTWENRLEYCVLFDMNCSGMQPFALDFKPYVHPIYNAILARLANQDQDQVC